MWKFVIFAVAAFILWKMFSGDMKRRKEAAQKEQETLIAKGEMVKDPACGSYVSPDNSVRLREGDKTLHFCSYECRDKYLKQLESSKTKEG
ncbi:MAG: TRASH domain-containing [Desulfovibrionaceae bacterium]|nr:MAG: TRASH domain-containing [Desulfovibrionaceae bacterium]